MQETKGVKAVTTEVRRTDPKTGGQKGEKDSAIGDACPMAMYELGRVYSHGRQKYSRGNYLRGYKWSLSYDALQRHLEMFWAGEETDNESGLHHLAHAAWHCLCLLAFVIRKVGRDDRLLPGKVVEVVEAEEEERNAA